MLNLLDGTEVQEVLLGLTRDVLAAIQPIVPNFFNILCSASSPRPLPLDNLFPDLSLVFLRDGFFFSP